MTNDAGSTPAQRFFVVAAFVFLIGVMLLWVGTAVPLDANPSAYAIQAYLAADLAHAVLAGWIVK